MDISKELALELYGLKDNFTEDDLKQQFRRLSKITHPDTGGDANLFKFVTECRNVLMGKSKEQTKNHNSSKAQSNSSNNHNNTQKAKKEKANVRLKTLYDIYYDLDKYIDEYDIQKIHTEIEVTMISRNKNARKTSTVYLSQAFNSFQDRICKVYYLN